MQGRVLGNFLRAVAAGSMVPCLFWLAASVAMGESIKTSALALPLVLMFAFMAVFAVAAVGGLPLALVLSRRGRESLKLYIGTAISLSVAVAIALVMLTPSYQTLGSVLFLVLVSITTGAVTSLVWWRSRLPARKAGATPVGSDR